MISLLSLIILLISGVFGIIFSKGRLAQYGSFISFLLFVISAFVKQDELVFNWISISSINFGLSFLFNKTGLLLCSIITALLFILHLSKNIYKNNVFLQYKLSFLNIFLFFMCFCILSNNLFQFFIGIEILGIISTLLVGIEEKAEKQSRNVFIFNKFASLCFLIALCLIAINVKSLEFANIKEYINSSKGDSLFIPSVLLLVFCLCKSAQIPFSSWLIDAIKAHTFASILIHAGTIIAVGIIFITKCYFIFDHFICLKNTMIVIGLITSFWMSICALRNTNIKKIMAYLTISSAGVMFISLGMGEYSLAILSFICHAFYKSMLFLSYSYVMVSMSGEQDILKMGGLNRLIPKINDTIWVSFLAFIGIPFFVNFFAKISFSSALQLSNMKHLTFSIILINIISISCVFRLILLSMYGKSRADESTISRALIGNTINTNSFWFLIGFSVLGSFIAWSMYEYGHLNFGYGGIVYIRGFFDYFVENIIEISQVFVSIIFVLTFLKYSNLKFYSKPIKNGFISNLFKKLSIFLVKKITVFDESLYSSIERYILNISVKIGAKLDKIHKRSLFSHAGWILFGIIISLSSILFLRGSYK